MSNLNEQQLEIRSEAFQGVLGEFVKRVEPTTEADPAAILVQALVGLGIYIGPRYYRSTGDQQRCKLFTVVVGNSSKARKGTSWNIVYELLSAVDESFTRNCILNGFGSGEAIIAKLKDPDQMNPDKVVEPRLVLAGGEFAQVLQVMNRDGNTLSTVIRDGWDNRPMASIVKSGEIKVSSHHIGVISHITRDELLALMRPEQHYNGFSNRFLYIWSKRSKLLPFPVPLDAAEFRHFGSRIRESVMALRHRDQFEFQFSADASELWAQLYTDLSRDLYDTVGAVLSRAEAQVTRLALIYAVLDGANYIGLDHLNAAMAVWEYSEASARRIFSQYTLSKSDKVLEALQTSKKLRRTDVHDLLGKNSNGLEIDRIKNELLARNLITVSFIKPQYGRPSEEWVYVQPAK